MKKRTLGIIPSLLNKLIIMKNLIMVRPASSWKRYHLQHIAGGRGE